MVTKLCQKRVAKEIQLYAQDNFKFPNLILRNCSDNILLWYFIVHGLQDTPFVGGVYFGKIILHPEYPLKPPDFFFLTPNGRFQTNTKICTTFSSFHQDTYTSTWNILTMMEGLISLMTDTTTDGIGSITTTDNEKHELAKCSMAWNKQLPLFGHVFGDVDSLLSD